MQSFERRTIHGWSVKGTENLKQFGIIITVLSYVWFYHVVFFDILPGVCVLPVNHSQHVMRELYCRNGATRRIQMSLRKRSKEHLTAARTIF